MKTRKAAPTATSTVSGAVNKEFLESVLPGFQRHWHSPGMGARSAKVTPTNVTTSMQKDEKPRLLTGQTDRHGSEARFTKDKHAVENES